jgi:hypothetical protein
MTNETLVEQKRIITARLLGLRSDTNELLMKLDALYTNAEQVDVAVLEPPAILPRARSKRYAVKVGGAELQYRENLWTRWTLHRTTEAISRGWKEGMRTSWSQEAAAEHLGIKDPTQLSRWLNGRIKGGPIEKSLRKDLERMTTAGIVPFIG